MCLIFLTIGYKGLAVTTPPPQTWGGGHPLSNFRVSFFMHPTSGGELTHPQPVDVPCLGDEGPTCCGHQLS